MDKQAENELVLAGERSQAVRKKLIERTPKSASIRFRGEQTLAQEVVGTVDLPHPIYIDSADGPHLTDVDGNQYIDLTGGFGPNVLGNKPLVVEQGPRVVLSGVPGLHACGCRGFSSATRGGWMRFSLHPHAHGIWCRDAPTPRT